MLSFLVCVTDEEEEEGIAEDDADMLPAESASSAATYWDRLLRHHWQALEKEEGGPHRVGKAFPLPVYLLSARLVLRKGGICVTVNLMGC